MLTVDERVEEIRENTCKLGLEINTFLADKKLYKYETLLAMLSLCAFELSTDNMKLALPLMALSRELLTARIDYEKEHGLLHTPEHN